MEEPVDAVGRIVEPLENISGGLKPCLARKTPSGFLCGGMVISHIAIMDIVQFIFCMFVILKHSYDLLDCGAENTIKAKDAIRCRECGYKILYKKRERKCMSLLFVYHRFHRQP